MTFNRAMTPAIHSRHPFSALRRFLCQGALCAAMLPAAAADTAAQQNAKPTTPAAEAAHATIVLPPVVVAGKPATLAVLDA